MNEPRDRPPLRALRALVQAREALAALERRLVVAAREDFASWREIGAALGVSRQAAQQRFLHLDPRPRRRRDPESEAFAALHQALQASAQGRLPASDPGKGD